MAEQTTITTPVTQTSVLDPQQVQINAPVNPTPEPDLITKVTNFKKAQTQAPAASNTDIGFDYKEIDAIKDPLAKEIAIKAYKSMESGVQKKFQDLANQRKVVETQLADMQTWTPEKVQKYLLSNPTFLQAAQQVSGNQNQNPSHVGLTDEQFSALTEKEKSELAQLPTLKNEINQLKQVNYQAIISQTDTQLRTKYNDYDPMVVDNSLRRIMNLQPHELRELVYKAEMHDEHVASAYALRTQEVNQLNQTRTNAISVDGNIITNDEGKPVRQPGQNDQAWWQTLSTWRLAQSRPK